MDKVFAFRRIVDDKTAKLESDIQVLKSCRNDASPIFKLSIEVFVCIVDLHSLDSIGIEWIGVTHVCKRWREVALDTPTLWTKIPIGYTRCHWGYEMLKRSKPASIEVSWTAPRKTRPQPVSGNILQTSDMICFVLTNDLARIHRLSLNAYANLSADDCKVVQETLLAQLTPQPLPRLHTLILSIPDEWTDSSSAKTVKNCLIKFFEECIAMTATLCLRHLVLRSITDWNCILGSDFRRLEIGGSATRPSSSQFFTRLCGMSSLRSLTLGSDTTLPDATVSPEAHLSSSEPSVTLKHIHDLFLRASPTKITNVLKHAPPSALAHIVLMCDNWDTSSTHQEFFFHLSRIYSSTSQPAEVVSFNDLSLTLSSTCMDLEAYVTVDGTSSDMSSCVDDDDDDTPSIRLNMMWERQVDNTPGEDKLRALMSKTFHSIPCHNLIKLSVDLSELGFQINRHEVFEALGSQINLRSLTLFGAKSTNFINIISGNNISAKDIRFPALQTLEFYDGLFENQGHLSFHSLMEYLGTRARAGIRIKSLVLESCQGLSRAMRTELRTVVPGMVWVKGDADSESSDSEEDSSLEDNEDTGEDDSVGNTYDTEEEDLEDGSANDEDVGDFSEEDEESGV